MIVHSIPVLDTNYTYVIVKGDECLIIDLGEAFPVRKFLKENGLKLKAILLTHKHKDHIDGVREIVKDFQVPVYGGENEDFPIVVEKLGDSISLLDEKIRVIKLPGHTRGGVGYYVKDCLFTGDVLFGGGCGLLLEGTAEEMVSSMDKIIGFPEDTKVYFGHEYTKRNLKFALHIEPTNDNIKKRLHSIKGSTTPSNVLLEKQTNPFLRLDESDIIERVDELMAKVVNSRVDRFDRLRQWKTEFDDSDWGV